MSMCSPLTAEHPGGATTEQTRMCAGESVGLHASTASTGFRGFDGQLSISPGVPVQAMLSPGGAAIAVAVENTQTKAARTRRGITGASEVAIRLPPMSPGPTSIAQA